MVTLARRTILMLLLGGIAPLSPAQSPQNAYRQLPVESGAQVTLKRRPAQPGDRIDQRVEVKLELESTTRAGAELVSQHETNLSRLQQQSMVADEVVEGRTVAARVRFDRSEHTLNDAPAETSPIAGQTYHCRRAGERLEVTRADGTLPNPQEHEQVSASMSSLGEVNPLAEYFAGKTIAVGEKLTLPSELGTTLLGGDGTLGKVSRFEMTLREVATEQGRQVARFDTEVEAEAEDGVQMRLLLAGTIELEVDTCRTVSLALNGPLARMSSFGSFSHRETTSVRGRMEIAMRAGYTDN